VKAPKIAAPARPPIAYGYSRVSLAKQVEKGLSLEDQGGEQLRYYKFRLEVDGVLWGQTFVDSERHGKDGRKRKGVSGKTRFIERPAGRELWMRLTAGDHVIFTRLDRAFRSFRDAVDVTEAWIAKGVHIHFVKENIDTGTIGGQLFLRMLAAFAEFERGMISERTRDAMRHRKRNGGVVNQYPGYGKRLEGQKGHRRVADDPNELKVMAAIVEMHDQRNMTFREIYFVLLKSNIRTRANKAWSFNRIYQSYLSYTSRSASSSSTPAKASNGHVSPTASPTN
jgi:DNA invertase Pin-like site-specific DNA recombinase